MPEVPIKLKCFRKSFHGRQRRGNKCQIITLTRFDEEYSQRKMQNNLLYFQTKRRPTNGGVVTLKTGRQEVPGSNPGRASWPSRSEFSFWFSPKLAWILARILLKDQHGGHSTYRRRSHKRTIGLKTYNQPTKETQNVQPSNFNFKYLVLRDLSRYSKGKYNWVKVHKQL